MDLYFTQKSVTDIPFYDCSALSNDKLDSLRGIAHPVRGIAVFAVGFPMLLVYIACLRVMVKLELIRNSCYKIMFVLGLFEITAVLLNDVVIAYSLVFAWSFCDAPNFFYILGCVTVATWAGSSFLCLYLAFNRILEVLNMGNPLIAFLFSSNCTCFGILIGMVYTLSFVFFATPTVYSNGAMAYIPNPLGLDMPILVKMRHNLMFADNCAVISSTAILYLVFCLTFREKFKKLGLHDDQHRLQRQVFIQSALLCGFNFSISLSYIIFMFLDQDVLFPQLCYIVYQFTLGLQALIYLLFNRTILDGVKDDLRGVLGIERVEITDMRTVKSVSMKSVEWNENPISSIIIV